MKLVTENPMTAIYFGSNPTFNGSYIDSWLTNEFLPTLYNKENIVKNSSNCSSTNDASPNSQEEKGKSKYIIKAITKMTIITPTFKNNCVFLLYFIEILLVFSTL